MSTAILKARISVNTSEFGRAMNKVREAAQQAGGSLRGISGQLNSLSAVTLGLAAGIGSKMAAAFGFAKLGQMITGQFTMAQTQISNMLKEFARIGDAGNYFKTLKRDILAVGTSAKTVGKEVIAMGQYLKITQGLKGRGNIVQKIKLAFELGEFKDIKSSFRGSMSRMKNTLKDLFLGSKIQIPANGLITGVGDISKGIRTGGLLSVGKSVGTILGKGLLGVGRIFAGAGLTAVVALAGAIKFGGPVVLAAVAALGIGIKKALDFGGQISDAAARIGGDSKGMVVLDQVAKDSGSSLDALLPSIQKFQSELGKGTNKEFVNSLSQIGLSVEQLRSVKSPVEQLKLIEKGMAGIEDPARRAALLMEMFGRSGGTLNTIFANPRAFEEAQNRLGKQADILGENADRFDRVSDQINSIGVKIRGFFVGVASKLLPLLEALGNWIDSIDLAGMGEKLGSALSSAINILINAFKEGKVTEIIGLGLKIAFKSSVNFLAGLLAGIFAAVPALIKANFESIGEFFAVLVDPDFWSGLGQVFVSIGYTLWGAALKFISLLMTGLKKPMSYIQAAVQFATQKLINAYERVFGDEKNVINTSFEEMYQENLKSGPSLFGATKEDYDKDAERAGEAAAKAAANAKNKLKPILDQSLTNGAERLKNILSEATRGFQDFSIFDVNGDKAKLAQILASLDKSVVSTAAPTKKKTDAENLDVGTAGSRVDKNVDAWAKVGLFVGSGGNNALVNSSRQTAQNTANIYKRLVQMGNNVPLAVAG